MALHRHTLPAAAVYLRRHTLISVLFLKMIEGGHESFLSDFLHISFYFYLCRANNKQVLTLFGKI